jgi:streptogramin lyase/predicted Ser/Thr protein kinase
MTVSSELRIGSELLGYRIERVLGRGGMGVVYLAHQLALDRMVALKLLAPEVAQDEAYRDRFLRESKVAASLDHPNIVPVHDAGEVDGRLYIAMRYVEGSDLRQLLEEEGPLSPERTIRLLGPIAEALDAAHARGLVHRDVKPSNILVDQTGRPYLADFGLTKQASERGFIEQSHFAASLDYVAPEQIERTPIGPAADVYSLGCVLHECLTGVPPYRRGSQLATLWAHVHDPPPKPTESDPDLPEAVDAVIARALAKEPDERYATCHELAEAAREALGVSDIVRVRSRVPLLLAVVGLTLAIGAGVAAFLLSRGGGPKELAGTTDSLVRIDPATNRVAERIRAGNGATGVAVGAGAVWLSSRDDGSVWRIDAQTREVTKILGFPQPGDVAVGRYSIYVGFRDGVGEINRANLGLGASTVSLGTSGQTPGVVSGPLGVWAADEIGRAVVRLQFTPRLSNTGVVARVPIEPVANEARGFDTLTGIAEGQGALWVTGDALEPALFRIDPATHRITRIPLPSAPGEVTAGAGAVWVAGQLEDVVWRLDPRSRTITDTIRVGRATSGIAVGSGAVWVASAIDGTVTRIDPARRAVVATISINGLPQGIAPGDGGVWVADRAQ